MKESQWRFAWLGTAALSLGWKSAAMGGTLVRIPVALDGTLGDPVTLVSAMSDETLRAPSYSPDGAWLAFERRKGPAQNPRDGALWLVAADGGTPIGLAAGAGPTGGGSSAAFMPAALPGHAFLLFASERLGRYVRAGRGAAAAVRGRH